MKSRALLIGLGAAAVAVAATLWMWRGDGGGDAEESDAPAARAGLDAAARPAARRGRPLRAGSSGSDPGGSSGASTEDTVRDHRGQAPTHPRPHRRGDRPVYVVQAPVIARLRASLRPEIKKCSDEFSQDLSPGAQVQGSLEVTVQSGVVSVVGVTVEQHGVAESSGLIECARKAFAAAQVRADGHADVERHTLRFPFKLPLR
jgi:hypothetical protein